MKKTIRFVFVTIMLLSTLMVSACGAKIENWPEDKFLRGVPSVQTGVMSGCVVSEDAQGMPYALIKVAEFTVSDMSDYIRILKDKGWEMLYSQMVVGDTVTYSAYNKDKIIHLVCNKVKNEMSIEVELKD